MSSAPGVRQGCSNLFSKATGGEAPSIKLRPGVALPHVTLPTTEVGVGVEEGSIGMGGKNRVWTPGKVVWFAVM